MFQATTRTHQLQHQIQWERQLTSPVAQIEVQDLSLPTSPDWPDLGHVPIFEPISGCEDRML